MLDEITEDHKLLSIKRQRKRGREKGQKSLFLLHHFFYFINIFSILILYLTTKGIIHISCSHLSIIFQHSKATFIIPILPINYSSTLIPPFISSQFSPFIIIIYFSLYSLPPFFSLSQRTLPYPSFQNHSYRISTNIFEVFISYHRITIILSYHVWIFSPSSRNAGMRKIFPDNPT